MSARIKHNFSKQHLRAAEYFATEAARTEATNREPSELVRTIHRSHVTAAIFCAVAFLEASINELYLSAVDMDLSVLPLFDERVFDLFAKVWIEVEMRPMLYKYEKAFLLIDKTPLEHSYNPYKDTENLIKLRNCLVHYKSEWDDEHGVHQKLENRLRGKFPLNRYAPQGSLWLPHQCLGAGCAEWAAATARGFLRCIL